MMHLRVPLEDRRARSLDLHAWGQLLASLAVACSDLVRLDLVLLLD